MLFKKAALALAVVSVASTSFASEQANPFFDDASLDLGFRSYQFWGEEDYKDPSKPTGKYDALGQGVRVDFKSGYFHDLIAVDAGVYTGFGIRTDDGNKGSWGLLGGGTANDDLIKYAVTAKVKLSDYGTFKYGTRMIHTDLYYDSDNRLVPELTQATSIEGGYGDLQGYAHHITRSSYRNTEKLVDFVEPVNIVGGSYIFDNALALNLSYGQQKDNTQQYFGSAKFPFSVAEGTMVVSANYQHFQAIGARKDTLKAENKEQDAGIWTTLVSYEQGPLRLDVAFGKVSSYQASDASTGDVGLDLEWDGGNENGGSNLLTDNAYYATLDQSDMKSYYAGGTYDLSQQVPGLSVDFGYMQGKNDALKSQEYFTRINYDVQSVKNLWVGATFATGEDEDKVGNGSVDWNHARLQLSYDFSAL